MRMILLPPLMVGLMFSTARAQSVYTWSACIEQTRKNNPALQAAQSNLQSARALESGSYSGYFPTLTGALSATRGNGGTGVTGGNLTDVGSTGAQTSYSASLSASENIFNGFQDQAKVDQAGAAREVAVAELQSARAKTSYDLKNGFVGLVYAQNLIQLTQDIIKRREYNLRLVQLRFESGGENKGSVLLSKAYLEQAKLDNMQARDALGQSQIQLAQVMGLAGPEDPRKDIQVSGEVPVQAPPSAVDLKSLALATPDYTQAVAQAKSSLAGITLARAGFFPSLNLSGTTADTGEEWFPDRNRWSLALTLNIPLLNGGKDYFSLKSAQDLYRTAEFNRFGQAGQSLAKVQQAYTAYVEAVQKLAVDQSFVEAAVVREKIAQQKYNNGLLTFDDWDIIETDLITRQKSYLQSQRDRVVAEAAWEQAQGKGVIP